MFNQLQISWSRGKLAATVVISLICVTAADFYSGSEIRVLPFYFIPIAISAINLGRRSSFITALACAGLWAASNFFEGVHYSSDWVWVWNTAVQGISFLFVAELISELYASKVRESELARVDMLTGALNIRGFHEQASRLIEFCQRAFHPVVLAYIDLDNFKTANDTLGHQRADELLKIAVNVMKTKLRSSDLLARVGGDEFVVVLPNLSTSTARDALERLRDDLAIRMSIEGCGITASIGAASYANAPDSLDKMLRAADEIMYVAKKSGKNCVTCHEIQEDKLNP